MRKNTANAFVGSTRMEEKADMAKIDWKYRREEAHKACPCICKDENESSCIDPRGEIDACYTCQQFHLEVDEIIEEGKKHDNA